MWQESLLYNHNFIPIEQQFSISGALQIHKNFPSSKP